MTVILPLNHSLTETGIQQYVEYVAYAQSLRVEMAMLKIVLQFQLTRLILMA